MRLFVRRDAYGRFFSCLVFVPRDRYNTHQGEDAGNLAASVRRHQRRVQRPPLGVRAGAPHFIVYVTPGENPDYDASAIEERLAEATRSWTDNLYEALIEHFGEERGIELFHKYRDAFPPGYRDGFLPRTAVADVARIEELESEEDIEMSLYHPLEEPENFLGFKLFRLGEQTSLSGILPLLEDMGVEVVDERPHKIEPAGSQSVWIYDFGLLQEADGELQTGEVREIFQDAFARAWRGTVENDGFNRLVLRARLTWRQVTVLRAYCKYLRQAGTTFSQNYMEDALFANPHIARLLVELFEARFDPSRQARGRDEERLRGDRRGARGGREPGRGPHPQELPERHPGDGAHELLPENAGGRAQTVPLLQVRPERDPRAASAPPEVRDLRLLPAWGRAPAGRQGRAGRHPVVRPQGGLPHEVLGLMKAQMVKNAVIVPVGAKGGFVVKRPPTQGGREALQDEVIGCYKTLIRGMLDLTDNLAGDRVVPPEDVVRYDEDDPYLVVAADKGTATFSDIANGISADYGFWLGDAFASGGAHGYDHKEMGITAKGAWESVKRHFRELGMDIQNEDFTVAGIGDMSGDVFGNGMLLSRHIKLVGAFNHLHIFLDPNPDPETSFEERERLFKLPRSSWSDYDESLHLRRRRRVLAHGQVHSLSPQVREMLGVEEDARRTR